MTIEPVVSRIIMADGKPFALLEDGRLVPIDKMRTINGRITRTPAKAYVILAGPLPPLGPDDPTAGNWLVFPPPPTPVSH